MKTYTAPEMEVAKFDVMDIITANESEGDPTYTEDF